MRQGLCQLLELPIITRIIIVLIVMNAVILGLETSATIMALVGEYLIIFDRAILMIFVVELAARLFVYRWQFWKDPWSVFDFIVVVIALAPAAGPFSVLRSMRVLRVLRLLTMVPSMRRVVGALLAAIPGLGSIALVSLIIYYVFAVIATNLFADAYPEWFGTLGRSLYTLFQIMTLESWSMGISRPVMERFPYAWAFFIPFILVATFTILNLFIAIIVSTMQNYAESEDEVKSGDKTKSKNNIKSKDNIKRSILLESEHSAEIDLQQQLKKLQSEVSELNALIRQDVLVKLQKDD